jgi:hypothetical protein
MKTLTADEIATIKKRVERGIPDWERKDFIEQVVMRLVLTAEKAYRVLD